MVTLVLINDSNGCNGSICILVPLAGAHQLPNMGVYFSMIILFQEISESLISRDFTSKNLTIIY